MNGLFALVKREKLPFSVAACFPDKNGGRYVAKRGEIGLVFEGKLFNRDQLLGMINPHNHGEISYCDADIALELFIQRGTESFNLLQGYWSLIVVNQDKKQIHAARDHFGNYPLYYCKTDTKLGITSEIKNLFSEVKNAREIDKNAVFDFLFLGNMGKYHQNFFSNIHELKPSCYLFYSLIDNVLEEQSYYILPYKNCKGGYNEYEEPFYVDKVRQLVIDSVKDNIKNKDKIAIEFDGEINSFSLLCCIKKLDKDIPITAFISTDIQDDKKIFRVEKAIKETNARLVRVPYNSRQIIRQLGEVNSMLNLPVFSPSSIIQYNVMATAKQHGFDAIMSEYGVNELFAGYTTYFIPFLKSLCSQWMFKDLGRELLLSRRFDTFFKEILSQKLKNLTRKIKSKEFAFLNKDYKNDYLPYLQNVEKNKSVLNDYLYESYTVFLPHFLRLCGHVANGLKMDCLMPFSNSKALAECVFSIPSIFKIHNGWANYLLRASMVGIVPDAIRWQKIDFHLSENKYFNEIESEIKEQIYQLEDTDNFIDKNTLLNEWKNLYKSNDIHFQQFIFRYCSYLVWQNGNF